MKNYNFFILEEEKKIRAQFGNIIAAKSITSEEVGILKKYDWSFLEKNFILFFKRGFSKKKIRRVRKGKIDWDDFYFYKTLCFKVYILGKILRQECPKIKKENFPSSSNPFCNFKKDNTILNFFLFFFKFFFKD